MNQACQVSLMGALLCAAIAAVAAHDRVRLGGMPHVIGIGVLMLLPETRVERLAWTTGLFAAGFILWRMGWIDAAGGRMAGCIGAALGAGAFAAVAVALGLQSVMLVVRGARRGTLSNQLRTLHRAAWSRVPAGLDSAFGDRVPLRLDVSLSIGAMALAAWCVVRA